MPPFPPNPAPAPSARPARTARTVLTLAAAGVAALTVVGFRNALDAAFVFDDLVQIVGRERRLAEPWAPWGFLSDQRPLTHLTLTVHYAIGALDPSGYHLGNVLIHAAAAAALLLTIVAVGRSLRARGAIATSDATLVTVATAASLAWALHPLQTAAVTYAIQRAESLSGLLVVLAARSFVRAAERPGMLRFALPVACTILALLAKPSAVFAPLLLFLLDSLVLAGSPREAVRRRGLLHAALWASLLTLVGTGAVRGLLAPDGTITGSGLGVVGTGPLEYATSQVRAIGLYATLVVNPSGMSIDHGREALDDPRLALAGGLVIGLAVGMLAAGVARRRWWGFLPAWFLVALAPTSSVVPLADPAADHRMYLPLAPIALGSACLVAWSVAAARRVSPGVGRAAGAAALLAAIATIVAEARATDARNRLYADPAALWSEVLARRPDHVRALVHRGGVALEQDRLDEAERDLLAAVAIEPGHPAALMNLGLVDLRRDRPAEALERLDLVASTYTFNPTLHAARGDALRGLGRPAEAADAFAMAGRRDPRDPHWPLLRGNALTEAGRLEEAAESFRIAAEVADDRAIRASALFNLGNTRFRQERHAEAAEAYRAALEARPDHAQAAEWLAEAMREAERGSR